MSIEVALVKTLPFQSLVSSTAFVHVDGYWRCLTLLAVDRKAALD